MDQPRLHSESQDNRVTQKDTVRKEGRQGGTEQKSHCEKRGIK